MLLKIQFLKNRYKFLKNREISIETSNFQKQLWNQKVNFDNRIIFCCFDWSAITFLWMNFWINFKIIKFSLTFNGSKSSTPSFDRLSLKNSVSLDACCCRFSAFWSSGMASSLSVSSSLCHRSRRSLFCNKNFVKLHRILVHYFKQIHEIFVLNKYYD